MQAITYITIDQEDKTISSILSNQCQYSLSVSLNKSGKLVLSLYSKQFEWMYEPCKLHA